MVRVWLLMAFCGGAGLGVMLAIVAAAVLEHMGAGGLLWTISAAGAFGLVALFSVHMLYLRR